MRALCLQDGRLDYRSDYPDPRPGPDEALVRVTRAGICATDLELTRGYKGGFCGVPGHEFVGVVEHAADPQWLGRRASATINVGCGACATCRASGPEHCAKRSVIGILGRDGAFAGYVAVPMGNLVALPDDLADERAVFAEPLAAALRIAEQIAVRPSNNIAVLGPGRLGMLVARSLSCFGAHVTMIGRRAETLELPRAWGLCTALDSDLGQQEFDVVVDTTGSASGFQRALDLVRPRGTLVVKSTFAGACEIALGKVVVNEIRIIGSRCGPFAPALRLLRDGAVDVDALVDGQYPLDRGVTAFAHAARPGVRKILLCP